VREIIRNEQITPIPNAQQYIEGVINLRGGIVVVVNLAMRLGVATKDADSNTRIIIIEVANNQIGMVVDSATEVLRIRQDQIQPAPAIVTSKIDAQYLRGVGILGERLLILLDLAKVLGESEISALEKVQSQAGSAPA
jgi:purine-binding chemotaxis protein CheW